MHINKFLITLVFAFNVFALEAPVFAKGEGELKSNKAGLGAAAEGDAENVFKNEGNFITGTTASMTLAIAAVIALALEAATDKSTVSTSTITSTSTSTN